MATPRKATPKKAVARKTAPKPPARKRAPAKKPAAKKTPAKRSSTKRQPAPAKVTDRDRQVLELRRAGVPFDKIATQLKIRTREDAHAAYERALAETLPQPADEVRRIELDRLERLMTPLWPKAMRGDLAAIAQLSQLSTKRTQIAGETMPLPEMPSERERGPVELATTAEVALLRMSDHTLGAAAVVLARLVDAADDNGLLAATVSRELRQTMTNLRNLSGAAGDHSNGKGSGDVVVPQSRLAEVRKRAEARGASRS